MEPLYIYDNGTIFKKLGYASEFSPYQMSLENDLLNTLHKVNLLYTTKNLMSHKDLSFFYEENIVNSLYFVKTGVLDLFSYNKLNGIVVDFGGKTTVSVVEDGLLVNEIHLHGTDYLDKSLINDIKSNKINYKLPQQSFTYDLYKLKNDLIELREIHQSELIKEIVSEAIRVVKLSSDVKSLQNNNLFLSGGGVTNSIYKIFIDEFNTLRNKVQYVKNYHTFLGGSIFGTINQSKALFISREEYNEIGENVFIQRLQ